MKAKVYPSEHAAKKAMREIRAMWPANDYAVSVAGFHGWHVCMVRDGKHYPCTAIAPLPFTVTASGSRVVFQVVGRATGNAMFDHKCWPTRRRAMSAIKRFAPTGCTSPVKFIGPIQPHVARRCTYLARVQRDGF